MYKDGDSNKDTGNTKPLSGTFATEKFNKLDCNILAPLAVYVIVVQASPSGKCPDGTGETL